MTPVRTLKTCALTLMIVLGFLGQTKTSQAQQLETLTVAGVCFWCVEADFEKVKGVNEAVSGFTGGAVTNPTYKQVVAGGTGLELGAGEQSCLCGGSPLIFSSTES